MARVAVEDGITVTACTPHVMPGVYDNTGPDILARIAALQGELDAAGIALKLVGGADAHLASNLIPGLKDGRVPRLNGSRYFLFEPPHHVAPPRLEHAVSDIMAAGFHPILTHPERLAWIETHYESIVRIANAGAWMQLTGGSITGRFGKRPKYWAERMLDAGMVAIVASDGHNLRNRKPQISDARAVVAQRLSEQAATDMVLTRPQGVLLDADPASLPGLNRVEPAQRGFLRSQIGRVMTGFLN